jgi:hypothetical protein
MPTVITEGAASARGFGFGGSGGSAQENYIEDVLSTYLYTGTGATQTITNGIDLSTKGGLVWIKCRNPGGTLHSLFDTSRGTGKFLDSAQAVAEITSATDSLTGFGASGFTLGADSIGGNVNWPNFTFASWTFRKQAKFFDVVTYTGTGANRTIAHNLGSTPGCIIVKRLDALADWRVYHSGLTSADYSLKLNLGASQVSEPSVWNSTAPTSSVFSVGTSTAVNDSGGTYVAYIYASNAGGFGAAGTNNVITCGSFTTDASSLATVNLGYEPQMVIVKGASTSSAWFMFDNMRGWSYSSARNINANTSAAETDQGANLMFPTATGFQVGGSGGTWLASSSSFIYIAIRRGPMKTPTDATKVFTPATRAGTGAAATTSNLSFPVDTVWSKGRDNGGTNSGDFDRLRGATQQLSLNQSNVETVASTSLTGFDVMTGYTAGADAVQLTINATGYNYVNWNFRRAPGFFDVVCYTGTGVARTVTHNLGIAPEFIQVKCRSNANGWMGYSAATGNTKYINFADVDSAQVGSTSWNNTSPTSSVFTVGTDNSVNGSARTYVAYLFATVAGVSKVGSYTGNGTTQTIDCGFGAGGARFVLIKRTDSTGNWYVYDTARGMTVLTDPYLLLNTTAAEVATLGSVTTVSTGFALNSTILAAINVSAGTYIFLAIA